MSTLNIFDLIIIICGLYMAINGVLMKTHKKINTGLVLAKNTPEERIRDKDGFIAYMWWKLTLIGVICTISGIVNIACSSVEGLEILSFVFNAVFFIILVIYGVVVTKAQKRFF